MKISDFLAIAPMFASEDKTRPTLSESFRLGNRVFVSDESQALVAKLPQCALVMPETHDKLQKGICDKTLQYIEAIESKIDAGEYVWYGYGDISGAVSEAVANLEPEMMRLRMNMLDSDDPDNDGMPYSVRLVQERHSAVIMANPARTVVNGYNASLIAGLIKNFGPVEAYAAKDDPHAELYFRGDNWKCIVMPLRVGGYDSSVHYWCYHAIADAKTGELIHAFGHTVNIDVLRFPAYKKEVEVGQ